MNEDLKKFEYQMIDSLEKCQTIMCALQKAEEVFIKLGMRNFAREFNAFIVERI